MTRRRFLCELLLASVVLACFAGWLWMASHPRVTRAQFLQVKEGMSREEVIRIAGGVPGDYSRGQCVLQPSGLRYWQQQTWLCDDGELLVCFDDADSATSVDVRDVSTLPPLTLTERIRRWLGL
jgi:hypothetical protein